MTPTPISPLPPSEGQVHWLCGREGGIGLIESGERLMLLTGQPGRPNSDVWELHQGAIDALLGLLGRFKQAGKLLDDTVWPKIPWGEGSTPAF